VQIVVSPRGVLSWREHSVRCALGRGGVRRDKREGDGATPAGHFPLREVFYRPDRLPPPAGGLPTRALDADLGWCDDPSHPAYNRRVRLPFSAGHERLWRDDEVYDLLAVIGYNDAPVRPGCGSAIFLHVARPDYAATKGCVALALADLASLLADCQPGDAVVIAV
jgi:L,D-peptidoglycan transpeptidase YkuD (ErfK/YbiS/YcfS/YnhG family)